jgi:hypothetical protein
MKYVLLLTQQQLDFLQAALDFSSGYYEDETIVFEREVLDKMQEAYSATEYLEKKPTFKNKQCTGIIDSMFTMKKRGNLT